MNRYALAALLVLVSFGLYAQQYRPAITITVGDITRQPFEDPAHSAIVNAANRRLQGGGGITGAIWRATGDLTDVCLEALKDPKNAHKIDADGLMVGQAVITSSKKLKHNNIVNYVVHTPGPHGVDYDRAALLANCYRNCLQVAEENDIHTIAFPSISTGIYGYPLKEATRIAVSTVVAYLKEHQETTCIREIRFVAWDMVTHDLYQAVLAEHKNRLL